MFGWLIRVNGEVLLIPINIAIFSPPATKPSSAAGALAAIWISPAANIWVTREPPMTKIN